MKGRKKEGKKSNDMYEIMQSGDDNISQTFSTSSKTLQPLSKNNFSFELRSAMNDNGSALWKSYVLSPSWASSSESLGGT